MDTLPQARRRSRATASQAESKLFGTLGQRLVRLRLKYKMGLYKNGASPQQLNAVFICVAESGFIAGVAVFIVFTACLPTWIRLLRHDAVFV